MILHKNLVLLRLSGPHERSELAALVPLERYLIGELSPLELLIDPAQLKSLLDAMEARGLRALVRRWSGRG